LPRALALGLLLLLVALGARADDWVEFRSERGGFTVAMPPGEARLVEKPPGEMGEITERRFLRFEGRSYLVSLTLFKADTLDPLSVFFLLKAENLTDLGDGDRLRLERSFELDGNPAVEVVVDKSDGRTLSLRAYAVGDRIIQTLVSGPGGSDAASDTRRFLDSLRLLPPR